MFIRKSIISMLSGIQATIDFTYDWTTKPIIVATDLKTSNPFTVVNEPEEEIVKQEEEIVE